MVEETTRPPETEERSTLVVGLAEEHRLGRAPDDGALLDIGFESLRSRR
jgi:hypothetical protein